MTVASDGAVSNLNVKKGNPLLAGSRNLRVLIGGFAPGQERSFELNCDFTLIDKMPEGMTNLLEPLHILVAAETRVTYEAVPSLARK
jgi:hypothetical protein